MATCISFCISTTAGGLSEGEKSVHMPGSPSAGCKRRARDTLPALCVPLCCPPSELPVTWIRKSRIVCLPPSHLRILRLLVRWRSRSPLSVSLPGLPCDRPVSRRGMIHEAPAHMGRLTSAWPSTQAESNHELLIPLDDRSAQTEQRERCCRCNQSGHDRYLHHLQAILPMKEAFQNRPHQSIPLRAAESRQVFSLLLPTISSLYAESADSSLTP